ncbi:hypothetical protein GS571_06395, partial [Rhodococcus hoagii]|nr:hypothetical protein [Prescottella equi]
PAACLTIISASKELIEGSVDATRGPWRSCPGYTTDLTARFPDERPAPTGRCGFRAFCRVTATWACEGRRFRFT